MADDTGFRLRNTSPLGDVDVPDIGQIVEYHHEVVVADETLATQLVESGHFTAVGKPGPKPTQPDADASASAATPDASGDTSPAAAGAETTPDGADQ